MEKEKTIFLNITGMHRRNLIRSGVEIAKGGKVLIMLHGRGGSAEDILSLSSYLAVEGFSLLAPQATNNTWYPYSFMAPVTQNEPWLSSALDWLKEITDDLNAKGILSSDIYFCGFSQGACLTLEFVTRGAQRWGGVAAFTGGLIGDQLDLQNYKGDFAGTPIFIGSSDPDMHVPVERVEATTAQLQSMHADVTQKLYKGMGHTISNDEIEQVNQLIFHV